jgi:hypothetical protein
MLLSVGNPPRVMTAGRGFHARAYWAVASWETGQDTWGRSIPQMSVIVITGSTPSRIRP